MGIEHFITFALTALFFIMTPGMDTLFILNKSIGKGKKSGIHATLGVNSGVLVHTALGALGLSLIIAQSTSAFTIIKFAGAAYIIYMGIIQLKSKANFIPTYQPNQKQSSVKSDFWSGFFTNTLNPKVALFFLAFFPQFIDPIQIKNPVPFILLGLTYAAIGIVWYLTLALFAGSFSQKIIAKPKVGMWIGKLSGVIFLLMGVTIALA